MIKIDVVVDELQWKNKIKRPKVFFQSILKLFPKKYNFKTKNKAFSLLLSNNKKIKILNKKFRKKNKSTDVLSFPFYEKKQLSYMIKKEKEIYLGDIIINLSKVKNKSNKMKFIKELNKLWIHGLVHLFGHKHGNERDFYKMNNLEKKYLRYIN